MRRFLLPLTLLVGCATGAVIHEYVVSPARAQPGAPTFQYKLIKGEDLLETVRARNPRFKDADDRSTIEEGMQGFGQAGWRYAGCMPVFGHCAYLIFESASGSVAPPPGQREVPAAPPPQQP